MGPGDTMGATNTESATSRATCPLEDFNLPTLASEKPTLTSLLGDNSQLDDSTPTAELETIKAELCDLGQNDEERISFLQSRLDALKVWIRDAFGVDDPHSVSSEAHSPKPNEDSPQNQPSDTNSSLSGALDKRAASGTEEAKPVLPLRIKLVDEKSKPVAGKTLRAAGTGSKNLSRMMSKPAEQTADTKAKIANQTPINVFWNYIDPFFKTIDENDLRALEDGSKFIDPLPFTIPPLGKHYEEKWKEQYGYVCGSRSTRRRTLQTYAEGGEAGAHPPLKVSSIRERLLAMMIEENLTVPETDTAESPTSADNETGNDAPTLGSPPPNEQAPIKSLDFIPVDERIKQELSQSGLCMFVPKIDYQEDDEICAEIRTLQRRLCETVCINHYRKRRLASVVREKLAAQEFYMLLSDIDKQIEQAFAKRSKLVKKKHKKSTSGVPISASPPTPSNQPAVPLVDTRDRLLTAFAEIIPSQMAFLTSSQEHLFDSQAEEQVLRYAHESGTWLPVPEQQSRARLAAKRAAHPVFPVVDPTRRQEQEKERQSSIQFERPTVI